MDFLSYITQDALILIPVMWVVGSVIKASNVLRNEMIPLIILALSIVLAIAILPDIPTAIIQGVLVGGASIGLHQVKKQIGKGG